MKSICLLFLLLPVGLLAQTLKPGYLITADYDTLSGYVGFSRAETMAYKAKKNGEESFYPLEELVGFQLEGDRFERHVVDVTMSNFPERRDVFLKVVVDGPVRFLEYEGTSLFGTLNTNHFLHHPGLEMPWLIPANDRQFKKQVASFFRENDDLYKEIKAGELTYADLNAIVIRYNIWSMAAPVEEAD